MSRSLKITANFVFKLHVAALETPRGDISLYPVMDGIYIATSDRSDLETFLKSVFKALAAVFVEESNPLFRFVIKGAFAFGPVVHGRDIPQRASETLHKEATYRNQLLLGLPMVQAHQSEKLAPPFGMFVHESARSFSPQGVEPFRNVWWYWFRDDPDARAKLAAKLDEHYQWCQEHSEQLLYEPERIRVHKSMAQEYLSASMVGG